jgi:hypothetical protein
MKGKAMLKKGLKTTMPPAPSAKAKGANINSEALRKSTAPQPRSLGGRKA